MQAIGGHFDITAKEQPIEELLAQSKLTSDTKAKLKVALEARKFATKVLHLPDNDSYTSYADLKRPYVVWSVTATPEFSVKPKQWCFLIVGCLSYRGYFDKAEAMQKADELKQQGLDVSITGTTAYSTLGYFDDPLLNTMLRHGESSMIGVIFHELAHQLIHEDGDTAFNEAFATSIEYEGLRRWYASRHEDRKFKIYIGKKGRQRIVFNFLKETRAELASLYKQDMPAEDKKVQKQNIINKLKLRYRNWQIQSGYHGFDAWMKKDLNNAHLALIATYQDLVPNFLGLLDSVQGDLQQFYGLVEALGELEKKQRHARLRKYETRKLTLNADAE